MNKQKTQLDERPLETLTKTVDPFMDIWRKEGVDPLLCR